MEKWLVVGNGNYARMMKRYMELSCKNIAAYVVSSKYIESQYMDDIPVMPMEQIEKYFLPSDVRLVMGIGYRQMGNIRKQVFNQCRSLGYSFYNYIHPTAIIEKNAIVGEGNNILEGVIIEESVKIGNANLIFGGSIIAHETQVGDFNSFSVRSVIAGCTIITNNCFIGAGATIRDHITVNEYSLIGAGSYVSCDTEAYSVLAAPQSTLLKDKISTDYL